MDKKEISVVICCLGMGSRLGVGNTKALVVVDGKSIIIRQLEMLDDYDDIRIIVGYQAKKIIDVVNEYRKDIMFGFNYVEGGPWTDDGIKSINKFYTKVERLVGSLKEDPTEIEELEKMLKG